ncbi:MAG: diacylglycerol/polyprenol kinase family protein [Candidatus Lokiarchaeia archaeon]
MYTSFWDLIYDIIILVIVCIFVLAIIGIGEVLRNRKGLDPGFTRKMIHFFAGNAILFCPFFINPQIIPLIPLIFAVLIFFASPKSPFEGMKSMFEVMARAEDYAAGHIYGPLYYIISIGILVAAFAFPAGTAYWPLFTIAAVGLFSMMYGDGLATIVGERWGKHKYTIRGCTRSIEGSLTVFIMTFLSAFLVLFYFSYFGFWPSFPLNQWLIIWLLYYFSPILSTYLTLSVLVSIPPIVPMLTLMLIVGIVGGIAAALIEGCSGRQLDNIFVPIIVTAVIFVLIFLMFPGYISVLSLNLGNLLPIL